MKVFLKSFGCSTNLADGEVMAGCLAKAGYKLVENFDEADIVIYNTCAVKEPTENRMISLLKRVPKGKKLIVAGCLPLINFERLRKEVKFEGVVGPAVGEKIVNVVKRVSTGEKVVFLSKALEAKPDLNLPRVRLNPLISIIPVNYGCLGACTYCCVKFSRGKLRSYTIQKILERVKKDLAEGVREFWITSQDTACYGRDIGTNLAELLEAICGVRGKFKIRVGMMTPNMAEEIVENLIHNFQDKHIFKFVHLPVQSGDNYVLKRMNRYYSVEEFKEIIYIFRKKIPRVTIATDVICGFPGETEEAFNNTLRLIGEVKPDIVNVSKFFVRPKTVASKMKDDFVPFKEIKRRSRLASDLAREIAFERNKSWVGWKGEVFIDEVGKFKNSWVGRNFAYKPVVIKNVNSNLLGENLKVKISKAFPTYLEGEIVY
ncbi:tRNA (N(6)-L-threonylcarbamoyladenosine(37)-C(2))-methylthiotransferase [Candidatus Bathyarchaeota archaeon]|nr:tRNA (N(6)-L-threonylcarbamoyladenosine(37)-C(2))-methylthiotransferase [Candidatus Bathyarchaeota archaeon]